MNNMATVLAENYQLKWHSHTSHLHSSVATLYRSETFTDVILATTDGRFFPTHKFVLSACSSYLNRVLQITCTSPTSSSQVVVMMPPEISYRTLAILLQYMYSGEATVSNDQLNSVLKAGEILRIKGLCHNKEKRPPSETPSHGSRKEMMNGGESPMKQVFVNVKSKSSKISDGGSSGEGLNGKQQSLLKTATPLKEKCVEKNVERETPESRDGPSTSSQSSNDRSGDIRIEENMKIELLVKEEPLDWDEQDVNCNNSEHEMEPEMSFKEEVQSQDEHENSMYAPLTCDMCQETFTTPALWVRHIETHPPTDVPRKRRKKNQSGEEVDDDTEFPPLRCELCEEVFTSPGDWVKHIQSAHTEEQLAINNIASSGSGRRKGSLGRETCPSCTKTFPSHASMLIHSRTHTGEKPYICCVCEKGFNVKSNLLRHLRTLHDHLVNPGDTN